MNRRYVTAIILMALAASLTLGACAAPEEAAPPKQHETAAPPSATIAREEPSASASPSPPAPSASRAPSQTPASPTPDPTPVPIGEIALDYDALNALDNTKKEWGQGVHMDEAGRSIAAVEAQDALSDLGGLFIMPDEPVLYLTFDEGYENGHTQSILDTLGEKGVQATFFVTYNYVSYNPELVQRMIDEGHSLGNHSVTHQSMPGLSIEEARDEIVRLHEYVEEQFGVRMTYFRPPMGHYSQRTLALAQQLGYTSAFWSFAYKDYEPDEQMGPEAALAKTTGDLHGGAIYLLHAVSSDNAQILGDFIDAARAAGYDIRPLP